MADIDGFLELGVMNARTEGFHRVIKQIKRIARAFRIQANHERRVMSHNVRVAQELSRCTSV